MVEDREMDEGSAETLICRDCPRKENCLEVLTEEEIKLRESRGIKYKRGLGAIEDLLRSLIGKSPRNSYFHKCVVFR